jgi:hypothetical protein
VRAHEPAAQIDVADLEPDRLGGAQAAAVHELEQGAVAKADRVGVAGALQQRRDLRMAEHVGQLARLLRRGQRRGRILGDQLLAAQVAIEGAQAGGLAADGGRRAPGAAAVSLRVRGDSRRQVGEEVSDVGALDRGRGAPAGADEGAELQEVGPVGVEGVAGQSALELEVGEEVEHQRLEMRVRWNL